MVKLLKDIKKRLRTAHTVTVDGDESRLGLSKDTQENIENLRGIWGNKEKHMAFIYVLYLRLT